MWGVEVVAVEKQHAADPVGGVGDLHLHARHPALEVAAQPVLLARLAPGCPRVDAVGNPEPHGLLELAHHGVVVVVAGEEHHALAVQALGDQVEKPLRLGDRVLDGGEQEVEQVAEQDQLVDVVEMRRETFERVGVRQQVVARPGTEVGVRDRQRTHRARRLVAPYYPVRDSATPSHTAMSPSPMPIDVGITPKCV
jgi:hypothetical protein